MSNKGILIILSGPSGVGKGTIREKLMLLGNLNLDYSISMTTRTPRIGEVNGTDYFFISREEFEQNIKDEKLLEWAEFVGNYYGTPCEYVEKVLKTGKNLLLEIEVEGALQVMERCQNPLTIFIVPPDMNELEKRIRGRRTEEETIVKQRLLKASKEMLLKNNYKYVVINDDANRAAGEVATIIEWHMKNNERTEN